jgi:Family of unknown function (DUF5832)
MASGFLEQDFTSVPGQIYALISLVGPDLPQKNDKFGLKIRGVFASKDEASAHAKRLQKEDATFDIYVVDMYKWLLIPPDRDQIDDVHYNEEKLEEIMTKYRENQSQAKSMFEKRKRDLVERKDYSDPSDENSKYYTRPDEPPISHPADVVEKLKQEHPDKSMDELVVLANDIIEGEMKDRQAWRVKNNVNTIEEEECSPSS